MNLSRLGIILGLVVSLSLVACAPPLTPSPSAVTPSPAGEVTATVTPACQEYLTVTDAQAAVPFEIVVASGPDAGTLERIEVCAPPFDVRLTYRLADGATLIARSLSPEGTYPLPEDPQMRAITVQGYDGWQGEVIAGMQGLLWERGDGVIYALVSPDLALEALLKLRVQPAYLQ